MILAEPIQVTQLLVKVFDRLQIPYLVSGSLASSLHGIPRATQDVDMVAGLKPQHVTPLVKALEAEFYIDADMIQDAIQQRSIILTFSGELAKWAWQIFWSKRLKMQVKQRLKRLSSDGKQKNSVYFYLIMSAFCLISGLKPDT
jgi:hypothetical protein